jgi:hypothetical protein
MAVPHLGRRSEARTAIALPLNVRPGAVLYIGYVGVALLVLTVLNRAWRPKLLAETAIRMALIAAIALPLGTICWPWAQASPFTRPIEALFGVAQFDWSGEVLYRGVDISGDALPWDYVPVWFVISTPPVVMLGLLVSWLRITNAESRWHVLALWGMVLFPAVAVMFRGSTLYDGIRHLLFVYPVVVIIAAGGWTALFSRVNQPYAAVAWGVLLLGVGEVLYFSVRNHPNQIVYVNALVGGPRGAFFRFDLDY